MRSSLLMAVAATAVLACGTTAFAQEDQWDLNHRETWLEHRIDRGVEDGSLDADEAHHIRTDIERIRDEQARLSQDNDGELAMADTERLEEQLDRVAHQIHWLKREADETPPWPD